MKAGLGSYTYTWACGVPGHPPAEPLTALALCQRAAALGAEVVQLCENVPLPREDWPRLKETGLEIEIGTRGLLGEHLADAWAAAEYFGAPFVRLVMDRDGHEPSYDEALRLLQPWAARARDTGIRVAIENHDRFPAAVLARLVEELGPDAAGVTLDTVNSFGALEPPDVVIDALAPHVLSLHVKDFTIRRVPSQMGFVIEGCPVGAGRLDVPALLARVRATGRDPHAIVELWTPLAATLEETISREEQWARESLTTLRQFIAA